MKSMLKSALLVGILTLSGLAAATPSHAIVDCSQKDGFACTQQGANSKCSYSDEGSGCFYIYPCWCDRAFGPLQWRCGPNPIQTSCPVSFTVPDEDAPEFFAQPAVASACTSTAAVAAPTVTP